MNNFRTEVIIKKSNFDITHQSKILTIGSCFSENIGNYLLTNKFNVLINPFGIVYNPYSIKDSINKIIDNYNFTDNDIFHHNEQWHSFYHHGKFSDSNKELILSNINNSINRSNAFLKESEYLIITFGSAYVYKYIEGNIIVSNCHKLPSKQFDQYMLDLDFIYNEWIDLLENIKNYNSNIKIIFTISPIRYLKYGLEMNQLSKSLLIMLVHKLKLKYSFIDYFPSYEIFMDDLRDYRFYKSDMIHPSELAIEYVWEKFSDCYFNTDTLKINKEVLSINNAMNHRPRNQRSDQHKNFLNNQLLKIHDLNNKYPFMDFSLEKKYFSTL